MNFDNHVFSWSGSLCQLISKTSYLNLVSANNDLLFSLIPGFRRPRMISARESEMKLTLLILSHFLVPVNTLDTSFKTTGLQVLFFWPSFKIFYRIHTKSLKRSQISIPNLSGWHNWAIFICLFSILTSNSQDTLYIFEFLQ